MTRALAACCAALFGVMVGIPITTVALPAIAHHFGSTLQSLQWVQSGFILAVAAVLLAAGSLADRLGRKPVLLAGLAILGLSSIAAALAPSELALILARVGQGLGSGLVIPAALGTVTAMSPAPRDRARALAWWSVVGGGASVTAGALFGGLLVDAFGWSAVFWLCVPLTVVGGVLVAALVPETRTAGRRPLDVPGQLLLAVLVTALAFGLIEGQRAGWLSPGILAAFGLGAAAAAVLVVTERRRSAPVIPVALFGDRVFLTAIASSVLGLTAFGGYLFALGLYLQEVRGLAPTAAGLLLAALGIPLIFSPMLAGRLVAAGRARSALALSGAFIAATGAGMLALAPLPVAWTVLPLAAFGIGYGLLNTPANATAVSELPDHQAALAASMMATSRQVGQILGIALAGVLLAADAAGSGIAHDSTAVWVLIAVCGAGVLALNVRGLRTLRVSCTADQLPLPGTR